MTATADVTIRHVRTVVSSQGSSETTEFKKTLENARIHKADFALVASAEAVIWDNSVVPSPLTEFDYLEIVSTIALEVQFITAAVTKGFSVTLELGKPFVLWSDASRDGTGTLGDAFDSNLAVNIVKIEVKESNAEAGELNLFMAKT